VAALLFVLLGTGAEIAFAHTRLISSEPAAGAALKTTPARVVLKFSASPEKGFSELQWAKDGEENWHRLDVVQQSRQLEAALPVLAPGRYKIRWSVLSRDGHRQRGALQFSID
jgi:methionine-rich copper-binding protein CopC